MGRLRLNRKTGERIFIGDDIIVEAGVGDEIIVEAPDDVEVLREELIEADETGETPGQARRRLRRG